MTGTAIVIQSHELDALRRRLDAMGHLNTKPLLRSLAAEGESQTRRRIESEKTSPEGQPWRGYASSDYELRKRQRSSGGLLESTGALLDSIRAFVEGDDTAGWGSNLVYAAIHQFGGTEDMAPGPAAIPARPYLGASEENMDDLVAIADDWLDQQMQRGL